MKKSIFEVIAQCVEKHFWIMAIILATAAIAAPIVVWLFYSVFPAFCSTEITADGMLGYIGTIVSGVLTFFLACVAIYQGKRNAELERELADWVRRNEMKPSLRISLIKLEDPTLFALSINNDGTSPALNVWLYDYPTFPIIRGGHSAEKRIGFGDTDAAGFVIDPYYVEWNEDEYPKKIDLIYRDIDNNVLAQTFKCVEGNEYEPQDAEYMYIAGT